MKKEIAAAVIASLTTATLLWAIGKFPRIANSVSVPEGAVVPFDREACPEIGWQEYKPAYGQFIRGVDRSGKNIDPDGERIVGNPQEDAFASHSHQERPSTGPNWLTKYLNKDGTWGDERQGNKLGPQTGESGGHETRPKNIALLFCEKL